MEQALDIKRAVAGAAQITVQGLAGSSNRKALIEEAIKAIATNPDTAFLETQMGFKNYAQFGDQREDHRYGYGPKHGSMVFVIGRTSGFKGKITEDAVYYLQAERDFDFYEDPQGRSGKLNLWAMLASYQRSAELTQRLREYLDGSVVDLVENN